MVGDIDNDKVVEIIGFKEDQRNTLGYESAGIKIFYYNTTTKQLALKREFLFSTTGGSTSATFGSMAIARYNNMGYIVVAGTDRYLYAYNPTGGRIWKSNVEYGSTAGIINIADFNNDGVPEVYIGDKIYSLSNGVLLCDGLGANSSGKIAGSGNFTVAADMDGDGKLELIAGTNIYKISITNNSGTSGNSIGLWSGMHLTATLPTYATNNGSTQVVDIDNDGKLEVVVSSLDATSRRTVVYVWKPQAGNQSYIMGSYLVPATAVSYSSIPMIGNIDSTIYPEIVFITNGSVLNMYALKFNPLSVKGSQISLKWNLVHTDASGCTGATLFDFNQDGRNEIVYRDQTDLRIIDGSNNPGANPDEIKATFNNVRSGTLREFPVIADIDGDGQAEIIVTGWDNIANTVNGVPASTQNGYLRLFKTNGSAWAPARKVWNQYAYNAVNVNEDLTIPAVQFNMAAQFAGGNGTLGDADDVRPYNNFLQQQTILNRDGEPLWLAPNGQIITTPTFSYNNDTDGMTISLQVKNVGDAPFQSPFKITVYKNSVSADSTKYTHTHTGIIGTGQTETLSFSIPNFSSWIQYNFIILKINDNGDGTNDQVVCDDSQGQYRYRGLLPTQQDVCLKKAGEINITCCFTLSSTGNDSYKWQMSKNGVTWPSDYIPGATSVSYTPSAQKQGIMYYRVEVTDNDTSEKVFSEPAKIRLRSCLLPVNHNISVMAY